MNCAILLLEHNAASLKLSLLFATTAQAVPGIQVQYMYRCRSAVTPGTVRRQNVHPRAGAEVAATPSVLYTWRCRAKFIASTIASTTNSHALIDTQNVWHVDQDPHTTGATLWCSSLSLTVLHSFISCRRWSCQWQSCTLRKHPPRSWNKGQDFGVKTKQKKRVDRASVSHGLARPTYISGSGHLYLRRAHANEKPPTVPWHIRE